MKILVVEDDPGIASLLQRGLRAAGFAVERAADGLTGLRMAQQKTAAALEKQGWTFTSPSRWTYGSC